MQRIKKDDEVIAIAGADKGRRGKVLQVVRNKSREITHALVEGIKIVKKAVKADPNAGVKGGIIKKESPIHISNVAIFNPETEKADRVFSKTLEDGTKVRCFKSSGELVDL